MDIGTEINQYQVVEHIGRGGMADVWSARDRELNRMVAIKTIVSGLIGDADPVTLFRKEAQTIAGLEHPHILPIYSFGEFKGKLYIAMRYVAGGALSDLLERGPLPVNEVMRLGTAIAQALDYAHTNKVVHLDLKPQNILLDSYQSPYLADFGLAAALDREGRVMNPGSGTLLYMAPEQLTAELIDHRADIYSFGILLYHMFTGRLPFDGAMPLALKQLQYHEDLPELENFPMYVSDLLRKSTAILPSERPLRLVDLMEELKTVLSDTVDVAALEFSMGFDEHSDMFAGGQMLDTDDADLLEAVDIYSRARHVWAGGQGRFLLGVTHFLLMSNYYKNAARYGLTVDAEGYQMLLRGALEYDRDIDFWWKFLDDDDRRWVCLHTIRSANAPARIRALYRIETLPDSETPRIPKLVAQALQAETDEQARIAALQVLTTRARLMKPTREYDIKTEYRGRMISSLTRFEIQVLPQADWQEAVYSPEIDILLAQTALDIASPAVAVAAARAIGRIRSKTAVRYITKQQRLGQKGALRALALVRDEAPNLPDVASRPLRAYAWLANTWRRVTDQPLALTWRFLFAVIGGWLAMGWQVYSTFRSEAVLAPDRIANTIAFGLTFGVFIGITVLLADELPARLRGFWQWWIRLAFSTLLGIGWATLAWSAATWMYLRQNPNVDLMLFGGFGLALGFILTALLHLRGWMATLVTAAAVFTTIYIPFNNWCQYLAICTQSPGFSVAPLAVVGFVVGVFAGTVLRVSRRNRGMTQTADGFKLPFKLPFTLPTLPSLSNLNQLPTVARDVLMVGLGTAWAVLMWGIYALVFANLPEIDALPWVTVIGFILFGMFAGALGGYWLEQKPRLAYGLAGTAAFLALLWVINPTIITYNVYDAAGNYLSQYGFAPQGNDALLYYDPNPSYFETAGLVVFDKLFTSGIAFAVFLALGGHAMSLGRDLRAVRRVVMARTQTAAMTEPVVATPDQPEPTAPTQEAPKPAPATISRMGSATVLDLREAFTDLLEEDALMGDYDVTQLKVRKDIEPD